MQRIASVVLALAIGVLTASGVAAAEVTNVDCRNAQSFCDDLFFPFHEEQFHGCLWFSFEVHVAQTVSITCSSLGGKFGLHGPYDAQSDPCRNNPPPACEGQYMDMLIIDDILQPGIYFITISYPSGVSNDVDIDVTRGLACDGEDPTNIDCVSALPFCSDLVQTFTEEWANHFDGCLWYTFTLEEEADVEIDVLSAGSKIYLYVANSENPCPRCGSAALMAGENSLAVNSALPAGVYFIAVSVNPGTPGPVQIDVIEGLGCEEEVEDPTNIDCGSALSFCSDLTQEFSEAWTNQYDGCLWYAFTLDEPGVVEIRIESPGSKIHLYSATAENPCPTCGSTALMAGENSLGLNGTLPAGLYFISVSISSGTPGPVQIDVGAGLECLPCDGCIPPFELDPKSFYIITAWVHVPGQPGDLPSFTTPKVLVESPPGTYLASFAPSGPIIDGWQRIEGIFQTPNPYQGLEVEFTASSGTVYYDDIRIMPEKASMKCYVYDPVNLRFVAELDERHYATFYEYDGEGKLVRVKKETERGVMTIQETRNSSSKLFGP